jgi:hypothetical protein
MNERPPVPEVLEGGADVPDLIRIWEDFNSGETWREVAAKNRGNGHAETAARALAQLPEVTALDALRANTRAVDLLTGRRWYVMKSAREAGATWAQIGEALGMTKQAAHDFYRRKIEEQQKYLPDLHDAPGARAVLEDWPPAGGPRRHRSPRAPDRARSAAPLPLVTRGSFVR